MYVLDNLFAQPLYGWLEFNFPSQHKYGYIRDEHNLYPSPLWSTSWSGALHFVHFFAKSVSFFRNTLPSVFLQYQNYIIYSSLSLNYMYYYYLEFYLLS